MADNQIALRATAIKAGRISMAHMRLAMTTPRDTAPETPAMRWGKLVHLAVLEPDTFAKVPHYPGAKRAGKAWDEFASLVRSGPYTMGDERETLKDIRAACARQLDRLPRIASTEVTIEWCDAMQYGNAMARVDALFDGGGWLELKTARSIAPRPFLSQAESLGYLLQLGWYDFGAKMLHMTGERWVLAVESAPPYATAIYHVAPHLLAHGYEQCVEIARRYRACEAVGSFPGPFDDVTLEFERPAWADGGSEVDMEGVSDE